MVTAFKIYYLHGEKITTNVFLKGCGAVDAVMF
ncbi:hypothetical protein C270_05250 [Leuconostoc carnosum JB16]|uniref:Uncharacterized protein n=1 Tax=Leuconostoc carnosum (strain JB16) TaxID=1229758 RepID=K0DD56_LEUCJ|nr:hypothetical protein C270_05250 [Leuconostoc carnosum JB16]